jgi:opacity protein-like surface antigen
MSIKKTVLISMSILAMHIQSKAQTAPTEKQFCINQGDFIIDAFYGYPYVLGNAIKEAFKPSNNAVNNTNVISITNLNHIGAKFEYMVTEDIGLGLEYTFAGVYMNYYNENTTTNGLIVKGFYDASLTKQRILGRVNFHYATTAHFDPYASIGAGYKKSVLKTNNPFDNELVDTFNAGILNAFPVSFRLGVGLRYFFNNNIGLNIEAGIGGPSVQGGLTVKF